MVSEENKGLFLMKENKRIWGRLRVANTCGEGIATLDPDGISEIEEGSGNF